MFLEKIIIKEEEMKKMKLLIFFNRWVHQVTGNEKFRI